MISPQVKARVESDGKLAADLGLRVNGPSVIVEGPGGTEVLQDSPSKEEIDAAVAALGGRRIAPFGAWRSLVARTVRVGEVPGSNPGAPIGKQASLRRASRFSLRSSGPRPGLRAQPARGRSG